MLSAAADLRRAGATERSDILLTEFAARTQMTPGIMLALSLNAQERKDWIAARQWSTQGRERFPDHPVFWSRETAMLIILGELDEADGLCRDGTRRFPDNIDVAMQGINATMMRGEWFRALARCVDVFTRFADHPHVVANASSIVEQIRLGLRRSDRDALRREALAADADRRWDIAVQFWAVLADILPDDLQAVVGHGRALRETGSLDDADLVFARAMAERPGNVELAANHAQVAVKRGDRVEAVRRWQKVLRAFPDATAVWSMAALAHQEAGLFDQAEDLFSRAIEFEPDRVELRIYHAHLAGRRGDWSQAVRRWNIAHRLDPDEPNIRNSLGDALWEEAALSLEAGDGTRLRDENLETFVDPGEDGRSLKRLALQFEGLGDNCEFGIVQRKLGADPLGLLRFAGIPPSTLIDLLGCRFAPLGDPEHTRLETTTGNEYFLLDDRFRFNTHTFVHRDTVDADEFLAKQVKRLGYLKRKIIEDLTAAEKIFVYKSTSAIDDETILRLHDALGSYGPNILLVGRLATAEKPAGTIGILRPGALVGYLGTVFGREGNPIDFDSWRKIMAAASAYRAAIPAVPSEPALSVGETR
ncbi:MAG: tetratricopeptide repeat protein [Gluconacetobacter diazotrophicus]|nr:tetratricopeptide repeat protein [Gluconacetobacter diazotrophicus]